MPRSEFRTEQDNLTVAAQRLQAKVEAFRTCAARKLDSPGGL